MYCNHEELHRLYVRVSDAILLDSLHVDYNYLDRPIIERDAEKLISRTEPKSMNKCSAGGIKELFSLKNATCAIKSQKLGGNNLTVVDNNFQAANVNEKTHSAKLLLDEEFATGFPSVTHHSKLSWRWLSGEKYWLPKRLQTRHKDGRNYCLCPPFLIKRNFFRFNNVRKSSLPRSASSIESNKNYIPAIFKKLTNSSTLVAVQNEEPVLHTTMVPGLSVSRGKSYRKAWPLVLNSGHEAKIYENYALLRNGAQVLEPTTSNCSYFPKKRVKVTYLIRQIIPWSISCENMPFNMLTSDLSKEKCFFIDSIPNNINIQLSDSAHVRYFIFDHSEESSNIDSSPRDFQVYGWSERNGKDVLLAKGVYDAEIAGKQKFVAIGSFREKFRFVRLRLLSNNGYEGGICLYQFGVYGFV